MNFFLALCLAVLLITGCSGDNASQSSVDNARIQQAFLNHESDVIVEGQGQVIKILKDDEHDSRHQRFIISVGDGATVLIAHNIDLAPRVENLAVGEPVYFKGEYEYNEKGGTIHWTHHDPRGRHPGGWIEYQGKKYF